MLRYSIKHYSGCFCERFLDEISIKSVEEIKQIAFPNVSGPHPIS